MAITNARERAIIEILHKNDTILHHPDGWFAGEVPSDSDLQNIARQILSDPMIANASGVAQEAYTPLKIAEEIVGLLNTAIPRGDDSDGDRRRRSLRRDVAELENPFDSESFRSQIFKWVDDFSMLTGSNAKAVEQILDLIDTDMAHRRLPNARAKITDLSLYFMDQVRNHMKRKFPW